ncbi:hypothetical protein HanPSC8_Chr10g0436431 [Helianthus annuus]|nr:hypothetical protein HanPSC8_Chr10g0436431 [Helianthus annuus]
MMIASDPGYEETRRLKNQSLKLCVHLKTSLMSQSLKFLPNKMLKMSRFNSLCTNHDLWTHNSSLITTAKFITLAHKPDFIKLHLTDSEFNIKIQI